MNPVWLLMFAIGIVGSNSLVISPIARDIALSFTAHSAPDVLMASAVYGAGTALSALILAPKADQMGLRRALVWALAVFALAIGMSAAAPSLEVLVASQAVAGFAAGLALPAIYGLAAELAPQGRESETLGKVLTGWTLSLVLGVSLSAFLADALNWRVVFATMSASALIILFVLFSSDVPDEAREVAPASPLSVINLPGLPPILFSVACYMAAFYGLYAFLGTHLTQDLGVSTTAAGLAALSYGLGFGLVAPLDRFIDKFGSTRSAPFVFATLLSVYVVLTLVAWSELLLLAVCFLWGAANHLGLNILVGQLTALSPERRGTILGLYSAVTYAAMFLGTSAFRPVFEAFGFAPAALLAAVCILPALASAIFKRRRLAPHR